MNRNRSPALTARNWEALIELDMDKALPFEKVRRFRPEGETDDRLPHAVSRSHLTRPRENFHRPRFG